MSATGTSPALSDQFFEFLGVVAARLPRDASVACFSSESRSRYSDDIAFRTAVGRLPSQVVVPASALETSETRSRAPEFVASFGGDYPDRRYTRLFQVSSGSVYQRKR
jgi:hypothetical protein